MRTSIARLIAALIAVLLPVVLLPSPAQAATITIVSRSGTTAGTPPVEMTSFDCTFPFSSPQSSTFTVDRAVGPGTPPLGTGSLRISQLQAGQLSGVGFENRALGGLAAFSGRFRSNMSGHVRGVLKVVTSGVTWIGEAFVTNLPVNTWTTANGVVASYQWVEQGEGNGTYQGTPAQFKNAHGWGTTSGYLAAGICNGISFSSVYVDNFRVSKGGGDTQVFDFEPKLSTSASISASRGVITNGGSTTLATTLRHNTKVLPGRKMVLLAKPSGGVYAQVGAAVTTNSNGVARKTVSPARNTTYQWYFNGDRNYRPAFSPVKSVGVRARVSLTLADSTLHSGQTLVATGRITPAKVDQVATLWRKTSSGRVKLGSVTLTETDGTYRITKMLSGKGTYKVYVTVPAAKGNLAGTSPIRTATVS